MNIRRLPILFFAALVLLAGPAAAQEDDGPTNRGFFRPLELPTVNAYRSGSGKPGPDYWQQRADYDIQVTLDPEARRLEGYETIRYTNNSPQPLEYLWIQLDQNLFRPGSRGAEIQPPDSRWRGAFEAGGYEISNVQVDGRDANYLIDDTRMRIALEEPMPANGSTVDISLGFAFQIPQYGADRMGWLEVEQGTVFELAQWYPRMYVYDDLDGWNVMPYLGQGEFYLEYGNFDLEITAPREFIIAATGELQNPDEVLTSEQQRRLEQARESAETVMIISPDEVGAADIRPAGDGMLTWEFRAENVRDVAWAASDAFIWDAAGWEDVLNMSFYPREGLGTPENPGWEESTEYVRHSIQYYSDMLLEYPYPVAINVAGIVGGMEYPMIVFCSVNARHHSLFGVTTHEIGHEWFPMIVGSDERRHAWMDEGLTTFINYYATLAYYGDEASENPYANRLTAEYIAELMVEGVEDAPIVTYPDLIPRADLGFLAYRKPGMGLRLLREHILGPERFDPAFREYAQRWAYKHPHPADFFRTMEDVAGEQLDWLWRGWFLDTDLLDQEIASVAETDGQTLVTVHHAEDLLMPVDLLIEYESGSTEIRRIPVEAFTNTDTFVEVIDETNVESVTIDPEGLLPDIERADNRWVSPTVDDAGVN